MLALCTASDVEFSIIENLQWARYEIQNDSQFARCDTIDGTLHILSVSPTLMDRINGYPIKTPEDIEKCASLGPTSAEVLEMIEPWHQNRASALASWTASVMITLLMNNTRFLPASAITAIRNPFASLLMNWCATGIPDDAKLLKDGDIVNIDVTVIKDGFHGDTSKMFIVGKPTIMGERLCRITQESLYLALRMVKPGINLREIGAAIQKFVEAEGFSVVREYCGHGIGRGFHEEPQVLHYDSRETNVVLKLG